jgi:transcriptional regulator GlxA family with amidase domain
LIKVEQRHVRDFYEIESVKHSWSARQLDRQISSLRDVTIASMAAIAGLEERSFLRRFRKATGLTPTEYCQHVRVGKAREILEFTSRTVEQIAWAVGYEDPGAFKKVFRKVTGLAPKDYRSRFARKGIAVSPALT